MLLCKPLQKTRRRAAVLPMVTICLIALIGVLALAVDIGLIADARAELQDHTDAAVLAAVRELDGIKSASTSSNDAQTTARSIVAQNTMFGKQLSSANVGAGGNVQSLDIGVYRYDNTTKKFEPKYEAPQSGENYSLCRMVLQMDQPLYFARIFGMTKQTLVTQAIAVHRPRDISIVLDFSGSMTFASRNSLRVSGSDMTYTNGTNRVAQNADPNFPRFGPWSIYPMDDPASPSGGSTPISPMQSLKKRLDVGGGYSYGSANITYETNAGPPIVLDFVVKQGSGASATFNVKPWGNDASSYPSGRATPLLTGYDLTTSPTRPTVLPAPEEIANQNIAGWDINIFGDKFPLKVLTPSAAPTGLDSDPADYAANAREWVNFVLNNYGALAGDSRRFPTTSSTSAMAGTNNWFNGTSGFDGTQERTDFTSNTAARNLHHRGFQSHGYGPDFKGFTMGPGYYGKTFYMWPPDPRTPSTGTPPAQGVVSTAASFYQWGDWRKRFFNFQDNGTNGNFNEIVWNSSGTRLTIASADVDYNKILQWIKSGPKVFPDNLRSGRVLYYDAIPDTIPTSGYTADQRFWKEYIDYVVGAGSYTVDQKMYGVSTSNAHTTNGTSRNYGGAGRTPTIDVNDLTATPYNMNYNDIPIHPRLHFWFGPASLIDFILSYTGAFGQGMMSGAMHEAQTWQLKVAVQSALDDIKKNHPNDTANLIFFSTLSEFKTPRSPLTNKYEDVKKLLWYPFTIGSQPPSVYLSDNTQEIRPYTASWGVNGHGIIPRGADGTCSHMGFRVAYNQFSANNAAPSGNGVGRNTAGKTLIFETDGVPNDTCGTDSTYFVSSTAGNSYYSQIGDAVGSSTGAATRPVETVTRMRDATTGYGNKCKVHAIAFGDLVELPLSAAGQTALNFLADVQNAGGTGMVGSGGSRSIQSFKIIRGDYQTRIDNMRSAFEKIMQGDVQLSLID